MIKDNKPWWHFWRCSCNTGTADNTARQRILEAAFNEIHRVGFQAASIQNILKETGLTKGALYHHFPNKKSLGYAVVDELIRPVVELHWVTPLQQEGNPIDHLKQTIVNSADQITMEDILHGCPLNNISQEMSSIDEGFRSRTEGIYQSWRKAIVNALEQGKQNGYVKTNVDSKQFSIVFVASLEGCLGMAKSAQDLSLLFSCGEGVMNLLENLRGDAE